MPTLQIDEKFRLLVESAIDYAIVTLDTEGNYDSWNSGAERLLGYQEQEAVGQHTGLIFTAEDRAKGEPEKELATARTRDRAEDERWHVRKNGMRFWGSGVMSPLRADDGTLLGYVKIFRDLTERKQLEEAFQAANTELESRVQERTAQLQAAHDIRRQLLQRSVNAQEEERRNLSRELHDQMGQQLTAILLGLNNLKSFAFAPEALPIIAQVSGLVHEITEQVHLVSFALRPTALDDLGLLAAIRNYSLQWSGWNKIPVDIELIGWDEEEILTGERQRLPREMETTIYRIVLESLTNITRHAKGATHVSLVFMRTTREVRVTVEDNGSGFDVEAAMNQSPEKRRLGLFGMQERAMLLGGTVSIESKKSSGTSVFLRIPLEGI